MIILIALCVIMCSVLPSAIIGAVLASERQCTVTVSAEKDSCADRVVHAVSAAAYDQVSRARADAINSLNLTAKHIDYLQKKQTLTTSSNAGSYSTHPAFDFSNTSGGSGRRQLADATIAHGGNMYIPNGAEAVGKTFYLIENGAYSNNMARMGASLTADSNPSSKDGWHQGAYSPYNWVGKTSNDDVAACDFPASWDVVGLDDTSQCYPPWGLMCANGHDEDVIQLKFYFLWKFNGKEVYDVKVKGEGDSTDNWPEPDLQVEVLQPTNFGTADAPIADVALKLTFGTGKMLSSTITNYEEIVYHLRADGSAEGAPSTGDFCTGASQQSTSSGWTISVG